MKASRLLLVAAAMLASVALEAQQTDADSTAGESARTTYAPASAGFGDDAAARSWEMASVTGELQGKLDSKSAKVGDQVVLKTTAKVQSPDGTIIPRGSRLVGHITEVEAHNSDRAIAQIGIAFDHVELKNGTSIAVHTLIHTVRPSFTPNMNAMDDMMNPASASGRIGGDVGGRNSSGLGGGGVVGVNPNLPGYPAGMGNGSVGDADASISRAGGPNTAPTGIGSGGIAPTLGGSAGAQNDGAVEVAGHGDAPAASGVHAAATARTVPHSTGIPGIMLAGVSTSSGLLINADRRNIELEGGTLFELGVVADR